MISNKRGAGTETIEILLRVIVALVLLYYAFKFGKSAADIFLGKSEAIDSLNQLAKDMNALQLDGNRNFISKETFIYLDKGSAIVGFSKNAKEFRCYSCEESNSEYQPDMILTNIIFYSYSIDKPFNQECNDKPCICFCKKDFIKGELDGDQIKITCGSFVCSSLDTDIYIRIPLQEALKSNGINLALPPYWENGFFFNRAKLPKTYPNTMSNGMMFPNYESKLKIGIEKKKINNQIYVAACMKLPCLPEENGN